MSIWNSVLCYCFLIRSLMAEVLQPLTSQKHKFTFKFCIQSLKLTFKDDMVQPSTPVAITLTKRGHAITTDYAPLTKQGKHSSEKWRCGYATCYHYRCYHWLCGCYCYWVGLWLFSLSQLLLKSAVSQLHGKMVLCKFPCRWIILWMGVLLRVRKSKFVYYQILAHRAKRTKAKSLQAVGLIWPIWGCSAMEMKVRHDTHKFARYASVLLTW